MRQIFTLLLIACTVLRISPASAQNWWWCLSAQAYYPQVLICPVGTWQAVYPPPASLQQVSRLPPPPVTPSPPQVTEEHVAGNEQFRCRDPNTNFVYERPQPCAKGDETLSGPASPPAAAAQNLDFPILPDTDPINSIPPDSFCGLHPTLRDCPKAWAVMKAMSHCWKIAQGSQHPQNDYAACMWANPEQAKEMNRLGTPK